MALPRPADAGSDRSRSGEPGGHHGDDRGAPARRPPPPGASRRSTPTPSSWTPSPTSSAAGGWTASSGGDVIFPLRMGRLSLHGDPPPEGTRVDCRIRVLEVQAPPGPGGCRDRPPRRSRLDADRRLGRLAVPLAVAVPRRVPGPRHDLRRRGAAAPRHRRRRGVRRVARPAGRHGPPGVEGRPGVDSARSRGTVGLPRPGGPGGHAVPTGSGDGSRPRKRPGGSGRRLEIPHASRPTWPIDTAADGRPWLLDRARPEDRDLPAISIAHAEGLTVALAARDAGSPWHRRRAGLRRCRAAEGSSHRGRVRPAGATAGRSRRREWMARFTRPGRRPPRRSASAPAGRPAGRGPVRRGRDRRRGRRARCKGLRGGGLLGRDRAGRTGRACLGMDSG